MDPYNFIDSDSSEGEFDGFNSNDVAGAQRNIVRQQQQQIISDSVDSSDSDFDNDTDCESGTLTDDDNQDNSCDSDDSDVPNLHEHPIEWTEDFQPINVPNFTHDSGPSLPTGWNSKSSPRDYFQLFWTDELLNNIVVYTNQYARLAIMKKRRSQPDYVDKEWSLDESNNITYDELCAYMGTNIIMSVNPYCQLKHAFSSDPFLANSGIRNVFTLKRFTKIGNYFCVSDKLCEPPKDSPYYDKLYKVQPVIEQMNRLFPKYYKFSSHQAIDESSIKTKSRDIMRNFCKSKPAKWAFRVWSRCDSTSADKPYLYQFKPYLGKKLTKISKHGLYFDVLNRLTYSLRGSNARIYTDSAYSSCKAALFLLKKGLFLTSTVCHNSIGLHSYVKVPPKKMARGAHKTFQDKNNPNLTCCVWKDTKPVCFISTESDPAIVTAALRRVSSSYVRINQPLIAHKYSNCYKSVDYFDYATTKYQLARRSYQSWIYIHSWVIQTSIVNAYILYIQTNTDPKPKKFSQSDFRILLGKQLINGFSCRKLQPSYEPLFVGPDVTTTQILDHENSRLNSTRGRNCHLHKKKFGISKRTVFGCRVCQFHLCKECHFSWHKPDMDGNDVPN